ncbi:hypothetical protein H696_03410 [Fonticula alba]|uniref:Protein kinase domain-containing protein n=1 Tax=Fonticula alba TaxID=691883 RepID=A0A058Z6R2_FONAL|nr:hypothetical protein H696_03410 [Fonticula alba]KCV69945.1 hypothetical protein H696_03410 [Fonticula alba]|eukprot:XP_009495551.1 hypothetical protein H696_03410 [Fonticula alba]
MSLVPSSPVGRRQSIWDRFKCLAKVGQGTYDIWSIGCIFAELLTLQAPFRGREVRPDRNNRSPFQRSQLERIFEWLGVPSVDRWPDLRNMPEYKEMLAMGNRYQDQLERMIAGRTSANGMSLLRSLLEYNPNHRITAAQALCHPYFAEAPHFTMNAFLVDTDRKRYPKRAEIADSNLPTTAVAVSQPVPAQSAPQHQQQPQPQYHQAASSSGKPPAAVAAPAAATAAATAAAARTTAVRPRHGPESSAPSQAQAVLLSGGPAAAVPSWPARRPVEGESSAPTSTSSLCSPALVRGGPMASQSSSVIDLTDLPRGGTTGGSSGPPSQHPPTKRHRHAGPSPATGDQPSSTLAPGPGAAAWHSAKPGPGLSSPLAPPPHPLSAHATPATSSSAQSSPSLGALSGGAGPGAFPSVTGAAPPQVHYLGSRRSHGGDPVSGHPGAQAYYQHLQSAQYQAPHPEYRHYRAGDAPAGPPGPGAADLSSPALGAAPSAEPVDQYRIQSGQSSPDLLAQQARARSAGGGSGGGGGGATGPYGTMSTGEHSAVTESPAVGALPGPSHRPLVSAPPPASGPPSSTASTPVASGAVPPPRGTALSGSGAPPPGGASGAPSYTTSHAHLHQHYLATAGVALSSPRAPRLGTSTADPPSHIEQYPVPGPGPGPSPAAYHPPQQPAQYSQQSRQQAPPIPGYHALASRPGSSHAKSGHSNAGGWPSHGPGPGTSSPLVTGDAAGPAAYSQAAGAYGPESGSSSASHSVSGSYSGGIISSPLASAKAHYRPGFHLPPQPQAQVSHHASHTGSTAAAYPGSHLSPHHGPPFAYPTPRSGADPGSEQAHAPQSGAYVYVRQRSQHPSASGPPSQQSSQYPHHPSEQPPTQLQFHQQSQLPSQQPQYSHPQQPQYPKYPPAPSQSQAHPQYQAASLADAVNYHQPTSGPGGGPPSPSQPQQF